MFDGAGSGVFSYDAGGGGPGMHNPGRLLAPPPIPRPGAGAGGGGFASSTGLSLGLVCYPILQPGRSCAQYHCVFIGLN